MEEALIARLLASAGVSAIYGNNVHWVVRPDGAASLPALTMTVIFDGRRYNHDAPDDLQQVRIQFDSRAATYGQAKKGLRAVLSEMEAEKDEGSIHFDEGRKVSGGDEATETLGGGTKVFHVTMDIMVTFRQIA